MHDVLYVMFLTVYALSSVSGHNIYRAFFDLERSIVSTQARISSKQLLLLSQRHSHFQLISSTNKGVIHPVQHTAMPCADRFMLMSTQHATLVS
jgi:hypothetical protein